MNSPRDVTAEDVITALTTTFKKTEVVDVTALQGWVSTAGIGTSMEHLTKVIKDLEGQGKIKTSKRWVSAKKEMLFVSLKR